MFHCFISTSVIPCDRGVQGERGRREIRRRGGQRERKRAALSMPPLEGEAKREKKRTWRENKGGGERTRDALLLLRVCCQGVIGKT
jgi:hypothetical protein